LHPTRSTEICIVGTGYVGMASAVGFAELGHVVRGYDIVPERVRSLQAGVTPYREAGIEELLCKHLRTGKIRFTEDLADAVRGAKYIIVAVGTPARDDGSADLSAVEDAIGRITPLRSPGATIVLRSTVPPSTTERLAGKTGANIIYAPEFLREGSAVKDFLNPDRVIVGAEPEETAKGYASLLEVLGCPIIVTSYRNAELIKGFSNAFLALKISFANEVANLCDALDADAQHVLHGVGKDRRIGTAFLSPGIGFGGPCFEKDVRSFHRVAQENGVGRELLEATLRVNARQPKRIVEILDQELAGLRDARVAIWGLAFKAGTDDIRDSLAIRIIDHLIERGATPVAYDPAVRVPAPVACELAPSALAALERADALLILTEWPEFKEVPPWALAAHLRRRIVVDGRNLLDPDAVAAAGLRYRGVGRRPSIEPSLAAVS
jgi:UDPglucose 6-dehydrogenase